MGALVSLTSRPPAPPPRLPPDVLEELHVATGLRASSLAAEFARFAALAETAPAGGPPASGAVSRAAFLRHPALAHHPLRERVATAFFGSPDPGARLGLRAYMLTMADFSTAAPLPTRLARAFGVWDVDGDGRLGLGDLLWVLARVAAFDAGAGIELAAEADPVLLSGGPVGEATAAAPKTTKLRAVAERVLAESSSAPDGASLSLDDFVRAASGAEAAGARSCLLLEEI